MKLYNVTISGDTLEEFLTDLENAREWVTTHSRELTEYGDTIENAETLESAISAVINGNQRVAELGGQNDEPPLEYALMMNEINPTAENNVENLTDLDRLYSEYFN